MNVLFLCRRPHKQPKQSNRGPRWVKDKAVYWCKHCQTDFSMVVRRHHCRHCGQVFCGHCTKNKRAVIKFGYVNPVRLCTKCNGLCFKSDLLLNAVGLDDLNTVRKICEEGCDVNFTTTVFPPATIAANRGFSDMVRLLLKYGADPKHAVPPTEAGLVVQCSQCGKTAAFDSSSKDAKYECPFCNNVTRYEQATDSDHTGMTALHAAVQKEGHLDCVVALLEANAEVDAKTQKGNTPLMYAAAGGHVECARVLIAHGASVNAQTEADGDVPLHKAIREGHAEVVQLLVDSGADGSLKNNSSISARQLADRMRHTQIISILSVAAANPVRVKPREVPPPAVAAEAKAAVIKPAKEIKPLPNPEEDQEDDEEAEMDPLDAVVDSNRRTMIHNRVDKWVEEAHKAGTHPPLTPSVLPSPRSEGVDTASTVSHVEPNIPSITATSLPTLSNVEQALEKQHDAEENHDHPAEDTQTHEPEAVVAHDHTVPVVESEILTHSAISTSEVQVAPPGEGEEEHEAADDGGGLAGEVEEATEQGHDKDEGAAEAELDQEPVKASGSSSSSGKKSKKKNRS